MTEAPTATVADPTLSLIVATTHGWPDYRAVFETHRAAIEAVGGELIVADSSGNPPPSADDVGPSVTWLSAPGAGVFVLRTQSYPVTRAPIVAHTEDHCVLDPDWGKTALELHREYPDAAVIGAVVENGSQEALNDWANFFVGHVWDMPGVGQGRQVEAAGLTCVTYKRRAIEGMTSIGELGVNEAYHQRQLSQSGESVLIDDRLRCSHVQSGGIRKSVSRTWHAARAGAAMRREKLTPRSLLRIALTPVLPVVYTAVIARQVAARRYHRGRALAAAPYIVGFLGVRVVAELVGYVAGVGDSASGFD
ncbi:MAG: hypothetical protein QOJ81_2247 [Chloroflexota bacterium]|jgi:hypothetical protein|nr:hypothetical protein [Chloroflexota bacterium]